MGEIVLALKKAVGDIRVTYGHRWMVWDEELVKWVVYERKPYQRFTKIITETAVEEQAVDKLLEE